VDVLANGSSLDVTDPRLKVEVHPGYYLDSAAQDIPIYIVSAVLVVLGMTIAWKGSNRSRPIPNS
jgi:hypothetical protein